MGRCLEKNVNFGSGRFLVKCSEKCIRKNNGNHFINSKFHVHLNDCERIHASPFRPRKRPCIQELWCCTHHLHLKLAFITRYFICASQVIMMVIVGFLITESQPFINIICGYYWQTQCQFLKKYENSVNWGDSLFIFFIILMNTSVSYSLKIEQQKYSSSHYPLD